ncbi:MAG: hypothetical protein CL847_00060 [Crocinitomicaceae bacterium]|nr:hypothetical protein [Crocinitomicaceae bacterium]
MENWEWGGMDDLENGVYMDENNRRMVTNVRLQMSNLSEALIDENDPKRALDVLDEVLRGTPQANVPFTRVLMPVAESYIKIANADTNLTSYADILSEEDRMRALDVAKELTEALFVQAEETITFSLSLTPEYYGAMEEDRQLSLQVCDRLQRVLKYYHPNDEYVDELKSRIDTIESNIENYQRMIVDLGSINF